MQAANVNYFFKMCGKEDKRYLEGEIISRERTTCVCRQRVAVLIQKIHIYIYTRNEICKISFTKHITKKK